MTLFTDDLKAAIEEAHGLVRTAGKGCAAVTDLKQAGDRVYLAQHPATF